MYSASLSRPASRAIPDTFYLVAAYAVLTGIVLYPIAMVEVPALGDYLNHLARMHVLTSIGESADLQRYYEVHWAPIPYLSMDAVVAFLARFMPLYDAGRVFIGLCLLLPVAGTAALHYAAHKRPSFIPLTAFLWSYNYILSWGFMNFLFSVGLCLLLLAAWVATENWPRLLRVAVFAAAAFILYLSHVYAFGAYCLGVAGFEIGRAARSRFLPAGKIAADWAVAAAQAIPAFVALSMTDLGRISDESLRTTYGDFAAKLRAIESPFFFLDGRADPAIAAIALSVLIGCMAFGRLRLAPAIWPAAAAVGTVAIFVPEWLLGTWGADFRLPIILVLLLTSALSITFPKRLARSWVLLPVSILVLLVGIKVSLVGAALEANGRLITEARTLMSHLPRGARLLPVHVDGRRGPLLSTHGRMTAHIGALATIERDAFVPFLFTGLTTVRPHDEMRNSSTPQGVPITVSELLAGLGKRDGAVLRSDRQGRRIYWLGWEKKFDFVLIQHFGADPGMLPPLLTLVATSNSADLYRIDAKKSAAPNPG